VAKIKENIEKINKDLAGNAKLIAVSKTFDHLSVKEAYAAGIRDFGENYLDEALEKIEKLNDLEDIIWHYQGRLQTKKINKMVGVFDCIHTLASEKHLLKIQQVAEEKNVKQQVLIQVKEEKDQRDYALNYDDLEAFVKKALSLKNINLSGLMFLPEQDLDEEVLKACFIRVSEAFKRYEPLCRSNGHKWDMVSMGMSGDYVLAAKNGATHVRVGSKIFGNRK